MQGFSKPKIIQFGGGAPLHELAQFLVKTWPEPLDLANVTVWLPTQIAAQTLRNYIINQNIKLLPRLRTLRWQSGVDGEMPGEKILTEAQERLLFHFAALKVRKKHGFQLLQPDLQAELARCLQTLVTRLIDYRVNKQDIATVVPDKLLNYWQLTADMVCDVWQEVEKHAAGRNLSAEYRYESLSYLCERARNEQLPLVICGGVDTLPTQRKLMKELLKTPNATLALAGGDVEGEKSVLTELLGALDLADYPIEKWSIYSKETPYSPPVYRMIESDTAADEIRVISASIRVKLGIKMGENGDDLRPNVEQEGQQREQKGSRLAIVCADDRLRLALHQALLNDGVPVAMAGGMPLYLSAVGLLVLRVLDVLAATCADGSGQPTTFAPNAMVTLAALGQHPLIRDQHAPAADGGIVFDWGSLERDVWRGVAPENWTEARQKAQTKIIASVIDLPLPEHVALLERLFGRTHTTLNDWQAWLSEALDTLAPAWRLAWGAAEIEAWWQSWEPLEEAANKTANETASHSPHTGQIAMDAAQFSRWARQDLLARKIKEPYHQLPPDAEATRLPIVNLWAPKDAVWQDVDVLFICGLNEGAWPASHDDIFLNARMLEQLGLPGPAQRDAVADYDWQHLLTAGREIFLTRHCHQGSEETVPSRYWQQLALTDTGKAALQRGQAFARPINLPIHASFQPATQADVNAALGRWPALGEAWPREWSASWIKDVMGCPYMAVATRRLGLKPWEAFGGLPDNAATGTHVHEWVEAFWQQKPDWPAPWPALGLGDLSLANAEQAVAHFIKIANFGLRHETEVVRLLWQARLPKLAEGLISHWRLVADEQGRSPALLEHKALLPMGGASVKAIIDRVDDSPDGMVILDYKTGTPPNPGEVLQGRAPQLALEALIMQQQQPEKPIKKLEYWRLKGYGRKPVEIKAIAPGKTITDIDDLLQHTRVGVEKLLSTFDAAADFPATPEPEGVCSRCPLSGMCRLQSFLSASDERVAENIVDNNTAA